MTIEIREFIYIFIFRIRRRNDLIKILGKIQFPRWEESASCSSKLSKLFLAAAKPLLSAAGKNDRGARTRSLARSQYSARARNLYRTISMI